jgi:hypothetical protein
MRNMLPFETRLSIYTSFTVAHFNYCSESWHFCNKSSSDKLEKVNELRIHFVFKDKSTPYEELLNKIGTIPLRHQRVNQIISNVYKLINYSNSPESLKDFLNLRQSTYSLRGKYILKLPKVNSTTYGLKSWRIKPMNYGTLFLI